VAWSQVARLLSSKAAGAGRRVVAVIPASSSQECSSCGHRTTALTRAERISACSWCGVVLDRDRNASLTMLAVGQHCLASAYKLPDLSGRVVTRLCQRAYERAIIPTAIDSPTATPTQTPQHAVVPPPPLLSVSSLRLVKSHSNQRSSSQTITNRSAQRIAWQWQATSPASHPSLAHRVNTSAQTKGLPAGRLSSACVRNAPTRAIL
jgi:hypothetical protein